MTFSLACGDVMPGCPSRFVNTTREGLRADIAEHAAAAHGLTNITPDVWSVIDTKTTVVGA